MSPVDLERKVSELDNDVQSIYELLNKISTTQQRQGNRITELTEMVAGHDSRFDAVDSRFDAVDARLDRIEASLDTVLELLRSGRPSPGP